MDIIIGIVVATVVVGGIVYKYKPEWIEVIKSYWKQSLMSYTFGSNEKPVLMTNKKNGGRIGKGSRPKKISVSKEQFDSNWDRIFKK